MGRQRGGQEHQERGRRLRRVRARREAEAGGGVCEEGERLEEAQAALRQVTPCPGGKQQVNPVDITLSKDPVSTVQGGPSALGKIYVDIKFKVPPPA